METKQLHINKWRSGGYNFVVLEHGRGAGFNYTLFKGKLYPKHPSIDGTQCEPFSNQAVIAKEILDAMESMTVTEEGQDISYIKMGEWCKTLLDIASSVDNTTEPATESNEYCDIIALPSGYFIIVDKLATVKATDTHSGAKEEIPIFYGRMVDANNNTIVVTETYNGDKGAKRWWRVTAHGVVQSFVYNETDDEHELSEQE